MIWRVCNHYLHQPLPEKRLEASMGTISRPFQSRQSSMVRPNCLSLGVAGSHLTWILNPWWSPVTR